MFNRNEIIDGAPSPRRKSFPWQEMEEYHPDGGMWAIPGAGQRQGFADATEKLMSNFPAFADAMRRAVREWPRSVAVALTTPGMNHRAWMGHAGCFLATGSPEESTRMGWHQLNDVEQYAANRAADLVITEWRRSVANRDDAPQLTFEDGWDA